MDERAALNLVTTHIDAAGDDCAVVDDVVITTDMLHDSMDFPPGTTRYTAGWRSVAASLSDIAAMGATARATVAVYGSPTFQQADLDAFIQGCQDVSEVVEAEYVGGDLDRHSELTIATTAIGYSEKPVYRTGASPGDAVCVTGTLGRSAAAVRLFEAGDTERANDLFRFTPRVKTGQVLASTATAMLDSSDGLARSLHILAAASNCGCAVESHALPVDPTVDEVASDEAERRDLTVHYGEDFELVVTIPESELASVQDRAPVPVARIGQVTESGITIDGEPLEDRGFTH